MHFALVPSGIVQIAIQQKAIIAKRMSHLPLKQFKLLI